ncbi:MAG: hypothetical protein JOZ05_10730 [Acetobacteraceae bacterium]|nr:hypothetical protein [Acetobacteraceae bacterium]
MRKILLSTALSLGLGLGLAANASAAPIVYNFTPASTDPFTGVIDLGSSENYNAGAGTPTITAYSGTVSGTTVSLRGILVGNNRGADEQGLGVCIGSTGFGGPCSSNPFSYNIDDHPEIDHNQNELVQLDISNLLNAGYNQLKV